MRYHRRRGIGRLTLPTPPVETPWPSHTDHLRLWHSVHFPLWEIPMPADQDPSQHVNHLPPRNGWACGRVNEVVQQYLCRYVLYQQDDWVRWLPIAEFSANNQEAAATKFTHSSSITVVTHASTPISSLPTPGHKLSTPKHPPISFQNYKASSAPQSYFRRINKNKTPTRLEPRPHPSKPVSRCLSLPKTSALPTPHTRWTGNAEAPSLSKKLSLPIHMK